MTMPRDHAPSVPVLEIRLPARRSVRREERAVDAADGDEGQGRAVMERDGRGPRRAIYRDVHARQQRRCDHATIAEADLLTLRVAERECGGEPMLSRVGRHVMR